MKVDCKPTGVVNELKLTFSDGLCFLQQHVVRHSAAPVYEQWRNNSKRRAS